MRLHPWMQMGSRLWMLAFWITCATVTTLALLPTAYLPPNLFNWWDKAQHALAFAVLGGLGLGAYPRHVPRVLIGLVLMGGCIELVQAATGWRYGEWFDWLADIVGVVLAGLLWRFLTRRSV